MTEEFQQRRENLAISRRIWRLHFWVALFTAPALVALACSGLIILYAQPLDVLLNRAMLVVAPSGSSVSLDAQVDAARAQMGPGAQLDAVTPPSAADRSTRVDFLADDGAQTGERNVTQVFVDPYTGDVLGQRRELDGLVGWANQVHRLFGNDGPTVSLPSVGHLISPAAYPDSTLKVGIGNLLIEMAAVWVLVLAFSGIYLWWPRAVESGKPRIVVRWRRGGRVRWRDLHATTGILLAVVLIGYIVSGLTWSRYWGENWRAIAATATPGTEIDAPSTPAEVGDFDRLGRRIAWADVEDPVIASQPPGAVPSSLGFEDIQRIARTEAMLPGFSIIPPADDSTNGITVFGSYTVVNPWPQRLSDQRTLYLDQFTGQTLAQATATQDGALARTTSWGVNMHMGTQYGVVSRIVATLACLALLTSIATAVAMWWKRRPAGSAGFPARDPGRTPSRRGRLVGIGAIAAVLGVLYPSFGVSLIAVLAIEALRARLRRPGRRPAPAR